MNTSISVVIPLYNGEKYILQSLEGVFRQSLTPTEIIVVNDGSTDDSPAMVEAQKAHAHCPLHLITQENAGTQVARNTGIKQAISPYVALLDQDDWWDADFLAQTSALIASDKVVFTNYQNVNESGQAIGKVVKPTLRQFNLPRLLLGNQVMPSIALLPKDLLVEVGLFDATFLASADWDMWIRLRLQGVKFVHLNKKLVNYRVHPENTSKDQSLMINNHRGVIAKTLAYPNLPACIADCHDKILASDHLYAAIRRIYDLRLTIDDYKGSDAKSRKLNEIEEEIKKELREAVGLYPSLDFWWVVLNGLAANSRGNLRGVLRLALAVSEEIDSPAQSRQVQALVNLVLARYDRELPLWARVQVLRDIRLWFKPVVRQLIRRIQGSSWLDE